MTKKCSRCELITKVQSMLRSSYVKMQQPSFKTYVAQFTSGDITLRQLGIAIGLTEQDILNFVDADDLDRCIDGNTK